MAKQASESGDDGTNDMLAGDVIRMNELQVWFVAQHVVDLPLARASNT
jgi:starvation-inducible DNA-binding protein